MPFHGVGASSVGVELGQLGGERDGFVVLVEREVYFALLQVFVALVVVGDDGSGSDKIDRFSQVSHKEFVIRNHSA